MWLDPVHDDEGMRVMPGGPVRPRSFVAGPSGMTTSGGSQIFAINPYEDHPSLSALEAEVLWEYAKLNQQIKDVRTTPSPITNTQETEQTITVSHPNTLCEQDARRDNVGKAQSFGTEDGLGFDVGTYFPLFCLGLGLLPILDHSSRLLYGAL